MAARRRDAIAAEIRLWSERAERGGAAVEEYTARLARLQGERKSLAEMPDAFILRRRALMAEVEDAEGRRRDAADRLAEAETGLAEADRAARDALEALSAPRRDHPLDRRQPRDDARRARRARRPQGRRAAARPDAGRDAAR